ncbi:MAG: metallophosphoesterase family protein [Bacteroidales bacterium]
MIKIGLISDTHAFLDEGVLNFLAPVHEIWHAGDIGNLHVLQRLEQEKPVRAVFGNIDDHQVRAACPKIQQFELEGVRVLMTHIGGYPGKYEPSIYHTLLSYHPKLFISGHSHILKVIPDKKLNLLHINPGAAGNSGFHQVRTATRFVLEAGNIRDLEIWETPR